MKAFPKVIRVRTANTRVATPRVPGLYPNKPLCSHSPRQPGTAITLPCLRRQAHTSLHHRQESLFKFSSDTIFALSTAEGRAGIAVIRISGPSALSILASLCPSKPPPKPRHATVRTLRDPDTPSVVLDTSALILHFPAPRTVTGEDVVELHVHGGTATVRAVLAAIPRCNKAAPPARYAGPGEFTRRAFLNGRMDLSQVEALGDTLSAATERQRRAAVRGSSSKLGQTYDRWREMLVSARGELEALIDFSEDQAFDESSALLLHNTARQVQTLLLSMEQHDAAGQRAELLRSGIGVALLGPVNVGKSSLMNAIVGREASIVSGEAGTTRDIVEASLDIGGFLCSFADTAGIRGGGEGESEIGKVEQEGMRRARVKAGKADVVVVMAAVEKDSSGEWVVKFDEETLALAASAKAALVVVNKCDAVDASTLERLLGGFQAHISASHPSLAAAAGVPMAISCRSADVPLPSIHLESPSPSSPSLADTPAHFPPTDPGGIHALTTALTTCFSTMTAVPDEGLLGVTERQRQLLVECRHHLREFSAEATRAVEGSGDEDIVLAAEYLRFAATCLARITGRGEGGDVHEVLGVVFER